MTPLHPLNCDPLTLQPVPSMIDPAQSQSGEPSANPIPNPAPHPTLVSSRFSPWLTPLVYPVGQHIVLPFYFKDIQVTGQEHLPGTGPVILAPTHRSRWDAIIVPYAVGRYVTGRDLRFMVTSDEMKGIQGWLIRRLGGFPIDTQRPGISSLRHGVDLLQAGEMLVIFPEGGIFRDRHPHCLKPGMARLALQAETSHPGLDLKVVPISIQYDPVIPGWRSQVQVAIGKPLAVTSYCHGPNKQSAQRLTADLQGALTDLAATQFPGLAASD